MTFRLLPWDWIRVPAWLSLPMTATSTSYARRLELIWGISTKSQRLGERHERCWRRSPERPVSHPMAGELPLFVVTQQRPACGPLGWMARVSECWHPTRHPHHLNPVPSGTRTERPSPLL